MIILAEQLQGHASTTITTGVFNNSQRVLSFTTADASKFPTPEPSYFVVAWSDAYTDPSSDPGMRIGLVTTRSGNTLTVRWGEQGTGFYPLSGTINIAVLSPNFSFADRKIIVSPAQVRATAASNPDNTPYVCDGVNDQVEIQNAINLVSACGGGVVELQQGDFYIGQAINPKHNVHLKGSGMLFGTKLIAVSTLPGSIIADTTSFTSVAPLDNFKATDLELDGSNMPTSPYSIGRKGIDSKCWRRCVLQNLYIHNFPATGIGIDMLDRCLIDHCIVKDCGTASQDQGSNGVGIGTGGMVDESFIVTNCITEGIANSAYLCEELDSVTVNRHYIFANNISYNDFKGVSISGASDVLISNNQIFNSTDDGIRVIDFSSHLASRVVINGNIIDSSGSEGVYIDTAVHDFTITNNHVRNGTIEGIIVRGPRGVISGNMVYGNGKHGIFIGAASGGSAVTDVVISDNIVYNNSAVTANTDGIRLDALNANINDVIVKGNRCFDTLGASGTQRYGIIISGGTLNRPIITDNNTVGNKTGGYLASSTTLVNPVIKNNVGINPDTLYAQGNVTGATTFDRTNGATISATLTGDITVTLSNGKGVGDTLTLVLTQDGTGSRLVTWPAAFKKAGGTLTLSTGAAAIDIINMRWDGTNWVEISRALNLS